MRTTSERLVILEGPDGGGKTTLAKKFLKLGYTYVHLGTFKEVGSDLARLYVEAIMPAVLGHAPVVLDRCWLSELPYGLAMRDGADRLGPRRRQLERLALRCQATLVRCLPPYDVALAAWRARSRKEGAEYLDTEAKFKAVYDWYAGLTHEGTALPVMTYDRTKLGELDARDVVSLSTFTTPHPLDRATAGNWDAPLVLLGEAFAEHHDGDALHRWPFGALSGSSSVWLTGQLAEAGISEAALLWANADMLPGSEALVDRLRRAKRVFTLGEKAADAVKDLGLSTVHHLGHPQHHKRFRFKDPYPLLHLLQEATR